MLSLITNPPVVVFINGEPKKFAKYFVLFNMKEQVELSRFSGFISGFPGSEKVKHSAIHSRRSRHEIIVLHKSRSLAEIKKI